MTDDSSHPEDVSTIPTHLTRRTALGALGAGALSLGTAGTVGADDDDDGHDTADSERFTIEGAGGPAPMQVGDSEGTPQTEEILEDDDLVFDLEPEFPPFVNFEEMKEQHDPADVYHYLEPHGAESLLGSQRVVVNPDGEPQTWREYSEENHPSEDGMAEATIEPASSGTDRGEGDGRDRSRVRIEFEGLYPNAYYTVWVVHRAGWHRPLGGNGGENNVFKTNDEGDSYIEAVDEPDELTLPPGETVDEEEDIDPIPITESPLHQLDTSPPPVAEDGTFAFVVAYHYDNRTWGPQPGPYFLSHVVMA